MTRRSTPGRRKSYPIKAPAAIQRFGLHAAKTKALSRVQVTPHNPRGPAGQVTGATRAGRVPLVDFEAILPFQVFALVVSPFTFLLPEKAIYVFAGILLASQFMIITRSFNREKGDRLGYVLVNEIYCAVTVALIVLGPVVIGRRPGVN
ncbi:MAG: hypothetical protein JWN40_103 [Phycisphaerales bacterium]|nr:hypothetical protein [Phycisphaerales bacterium]